MSMFISLIFLQAGAALPAGISVSPASAPASAIATAEPTAAKTCRDMLVSSSRLGTIRVCKTRAAWRQWERCHSATRYCAKPKKQARLTALSPNDTVICKYMRTTGTRIGNERMCATKRQWDLVEQETQEVIRDRQSRSMLTGGSETPGARPGLGGGGPL